MNILESLLDSSSHSIFALDHDGIVTHINRQAKERFGLFNHSSESHPAGRLEQGDLIIMATSAMGADDGGLQQEDLAVLGICDKKLQPGDMLAAVGVFGESQLRPVYKYLRRRDATALHLETVWEGIPIRIAIDGKEVSVTVHDTTYAISYFMSICQCVVLDGKTGEVKFWEEKGYSARKEGIGNLLRGASFQAKSPDGEIKVEGYYFREFFEGDRFEQHLQDVLSGKVSRYEDEEYEINGYALSASILPVEEDGTISGVIVKFRRFEDIRVTIMERNSAISAAERKFRAAELGLPAENMEFTALFGNSPAMASVRRYAYRLSQLDCNVLLTGESGTGKSFLARAIAQAQPRKGPFITVDCSTVTPTLFESEMFGYVGGAFTGANPKGKAGFFEEADGGTIFLDEIGEIPLNIQAKLLNVIQNKTLTRVGSTKTIPVDVRIIAATNRNLRQEVSAGRFRQDLYYRLSAFAVELPPLRECQEDLYVLINNLMDRIREKYRVPDKYLSGEAFSRLLMYDWPGNIRELENVLESAVALSESDIIYAEHIRLESEPERLTLKDRLKAEEKRIIRQTLAQCGGNRTAAMEELGLSKTVFYGKLKEYQLS
ncbi:MAG: sigma 54-interacting transcriptional regulator [Oscillospiraceae bacterium]|nr:sigma 54-interacting transcriptional regulator [Oscillospiraceae bacterium]